MPRPPDVDLETAFSRNLAFLRRFGPALPRHLCLIGIHLGAHPLRDAGQYGGALQMLVLVRAETLKATEAMLQQKRYSVLRRGNLNYSIQGQSHALDEAKISALEPDLLAATVERDRHQAEASLYTGGFSQTVALMSAATAEMTISQLRFALLNERYGLALPASAGPRRTRGWRMSANVRSDGEIADVGLPNEDCSHR